jgi:ribosomal protein L7/L12
MDYSGLGIAAAIGGAIGWLSSGTNTGRTEAQVSALSSQVRELQTKLDALLKHHGVEMPPPPSSDLSPVLQAMARDKNQLIAAIKLYREERPGTGLAEAKTRIEAFYKTGK